MLRGEDAIAPENLTRGPEDAPKRPKMKPRNSQAQGNVFDTSDVMPV